MAMDAHTFIDGSEVVQHAVGPVDSRFQIGQEIANAVTGNPQTRNPVARVLGGQHRAAERLLNFLGDAYGRVHELVSEQELRSYSAVEEPSASVVHYASNRAEMVKPGVRRSGRRRPSLADAF